METGGIIKAPYQELEEKWAKYNNKKYGITSNSGTSALHLSLLSLGIGKGDEVIVPDFSMAAAAFAVSYTGAKPVFVDCGTDLNMDVTKIERKITHRTKGIVAVHIYGRLCDMDAINVIAKKYKLWVVEDACEVHGAAVGKAHITCFSFYQNKIVNAEEGGIALTDHKFLADKMNYLKNMAMGPVRDYRHQQIGYNYRMPNSQAVLALESLSEINRNLVKRKKIEQWYNENLPEYIQMPKRDVVWVYDIVCTSKHRILESIKGSRPFFIPMTDLPMYKEKGSSMANLMSEYGLYLPVNPAMTKKDVLNICKKVKELI